MSAVRIALCTTCFISIEGTITGSKAMPPKLMSSGIIPEKSIPSRKKNHTTANPSIAPATPAAAVSRIPSM